MIKYLRPFLLSLVLSLGVLPIRGYVSNDMFFNRLGIEDGLSQMSVMRIYQDELGTFWFATMEGLNRYNGRVMDIFRNIPSDSTSLAHNEVKYVCGNKNGHVLIHTLEGIVNCYDMRKQKMWRLPPIAATAIGDGNGRLWIAEHNQLYLYNPDKREKTLYATLSPTDEIRRVEETRDGKILLGTRSTGVYCLDANYKARRILPTTSLVSVIFEDSRKTLWVGTWEEGLFRLDRNGTIFHYIPSSSSDGNSVSSHFVRTVTEDNAGQIWIGTYKGLDKFIVNQNLFVHYGAGTNPIGQLSNQSVWSLHYDRHGTLWVGTYFGGVNYFHPDANYYQFHRLPLHRDQHTPFPIISTLVENPDGTLYLGTEGDGLYHYNPENGAVQHYTIRNSDERSISSDNIKCSYLDKEQRMLYLGTHLGGVCSFNLTTKQFRRYSMPVDPQDSEGTNIVRSITPYNNSLLIATQNGLFLLDPQSGSASLFCDTLHRKVKFYVDAKVDKFGQIWFIGSGLWCYNPKNKNLTAFSHDPSQEGSISNYQMTKLFIDSHERLWVAFNGGGVDLFDAPTGEFVHFNSTSCGLQNDYVSNIIESPMGYILIATTKGFSILDAESKKVINYARKNGFPLSSLYNGGMTVSSKGLIYVAGMDGMISFYENQLSLPARTMSLYLDYLTINSHTILPDDDTGLLDVALPFTPKIHLSYDQKLITLGFHVDNYMPTGRPVYRYQLEGYNLEWTMLDSDANQLQLMNLSPGKYTLRLQALSTEDSQVLASTQLEIYMSPPIYASWYACLFYIAIILIVVFWYRSSVQSKTRLQATLDYELQSKDQAAETNQSKLRFFTNISHEFRTPLTLIAGHVDMLLQMTKVPPAIYNRILSIKRNTLTMQNLITELLEFRKVEQGHLHLKVCELDLVKFIHEIYLSFTEYATYRGIQLKFQFDSERMMLHFDALQMQKVLYNLISNAFKHTPRGGTITIDLVELAESIQLTIADTGCGIAPQELDRIFDRFYQAENGVNLSNLNPGTGIGLALTKGILEEHRATIEVESQKEVGTSFRIMLFKGLSHLHHCTFVSPEDADYDAVAHELTTTDEEFIQEIAMERSSDEDRPTILIVEDNDELRAMLTKIFEVLFVVHLAENGQQGFDKTIELQPNLVLSDVMMPVMSGTEMCAKIKATFDICHIPVVLLTAQSTIEFAIEGLQQGADDYITKPFNIRSLVTRCNNLVHSRKILQERFTQQPEFNPGSVATNRMDQEFLERAYRLIEGNLDNTDFDVVEFSTQMGLGRTKLFVKIKGITGMTPNDFVMSVKMKKASEMLQNSPEMNIADITYALGFCSPKYFTKCFKKHFGQPPTVYRKGEE